MRAGLAVWGAWIAVFLGLELPAHWRAVPWPTLSSTAWDVEADWHPASLFFEAFLLVLCAHIVYRLNVAALLAVVGCAVVALAVHLVVGTP